MSQTTSVPTREMTEFIEHKNQSTLNADPLADSAVAAMVGRWAPEPELRRDAPQWKNMATVGRLLGRQLTNQDVQNPRHLLEQMPLTSEQADVVSQFLQAAATLPAWADPEKIERAGRLFRQHGSTCSIILFCGSLPEVYAYGSITDVLHSSQRLESKAAARIRSTANLVLPIMVEGGLTDPSKSGVASVVKARLIHALVRNLILRGCAHEVVGQLGRQGCVPAIDAAAAAAERALSPWETMFCGGWDIGLNGVPCNQSEQGYVILCFSHILVRSLKRLGIPLSKDDEEAFFHAWNVVAHIIGVDETMMAWNASQAKELFEAHQARSVERELCDSLALGVGYVDPRPAHARALIETMSSVIFGSIFKEFPELLMRMLCGERTLKVLGLVDSSPPAAAAVFHSSMALARWLDKAMRLTGAQGCAVETIVDTLGDRFITEILQLDIEQLRSAMGKSQSTLPQRVLGSPAALLKTLASIKL